MKLLSLDFHGFKSFADSASIQFHDGITAIIGPNGCGKSNISDALRWVLGEQRPTAIRGARMEEAIFQGTKIRKPIHRAEVSLKLSNDDHILPVPYSEVALARTVYRGGEGEYRLNGTLCRLRDIHDLCRDTGLGTNAYAIIEGRMIDAILSDHAEERRQMFEEAAGIGRYKERRRVAGRRLDEADADLSRVDDLISEIETKVRSLARQRGRARKYHELRARKLAVELALAQFDLIRLQQRRSVISGELERLEELKLTHSTRQRSAEAEHESARSKLSTLERDRSGSARKLMEVRDQLAEFEKERLLAQERARHSRYRLEQIADERRELADRKGVLTGDHEELARKRVERGAVVESIRTRLEEKEAELARVSEERQAREEAATAIERHAQAYRESKARLEARLEGARARAEERASRLADVERGATALSSALAGREAEAEASRREAEAARARLDAVTEELSGERRELDRVQSALDEQRSRVAGVAEGLHAARARIEAIAPLATGEAGLNPAVRAALSKADKLGILDVLGRSLDVTQDMVEGVESYLGSLMEALIVSDSEAARRIRSWFLDQYEGPGGLILLPLDRLPVTGSSSPLPTGVRATGAGAAWASYLLHDVRFGGDEPAGEAWIGRRVSVDSLGIHRLGQPLAGGGLLAHRAELESLRGRETELERTLSGLTKELRRSEQDVAKRATRIETLENARLSAEEDLARLGARAEAAAEHFSQAEAEAQAALDAVIQLREDREAALDEASAAEVELRALKPAGAESAPDPERLAAVRQEWEALQGSVAELRVAEARAVADHESVARDLKARSVAAEATAEAAQRLSNEAEGLSTALAAAEEKSEGLATELERLFEERTSCEEDARRLEEAAETLRLQVEEMETSLRRVQHQEREDSEKRHELDLERSELQSELRRVRERLEDEWGRPFDELLAEAEPAEGEAEELREELTAVAESLARIGLVNMLAEEEYVEEKERLEFLRAQQNDLVKARDDLRNTMRQINETASQALLETLNKIRGYFHQTFMTLFQGGECDVWLADPEDPLDSPIEISASPGGKKTQRIHLMSGGERALTALSLLFAIYLVKPSPFCVLDEVDAPLDETNIRRFVAMLEQFKSNVQFIVITHNPVTIEAADWIYGVTMEEPGVSKIVGVEFGEYARGAVA